MGRGCHGSDIWQPTWKPSGVGFSVWLSSKASEEKKSMSWMIKGGSSSAWEQSPLPSPRNGLARRGVAPTKHETRNATCSDYVDDGRWGARAASTTRSADTSWTVNAAGEPPAGKDVYPSEGFG